MVRAVRACSLSWLVMSLSQMMEHKNTGSNSLKSFMAAHSINSGKQGVDKVTSGSWPAFNHGFIRPFCCPCHLTSHNISKSAGRSS